jgi:release factor glutamine methyltransferase
MTQAKTIKTILLSAAEKLLTEDAKLEGQLLLQHILNVNRAWLIAHENDALQPNIHAVFEVLLNRRLNGEPMAYILGCREFYGLDLMVTPDTLIPRPDTETLVEAALAKISINSNQSILDLGTGTGAIALAIAKNHLQANITAVDASKGALEVAQKNAQNLSINNIEFVLSNWFENLANQRFDIIVSNPPYIEENDVHLTQGDLRFEPISALASGVDGLDDIRQIINDGLIYLKPQGWLMLEHGYNQAAQVADLMADVGLTNIETIKDLGNNDRVTIGKNPLIVSTHWD